MSGLLLPFLLHQILYHVMKLEMIARFFVDWYLYAYLISKKRDACNNQIDISCVLETIFNIDVLDMTLSIREFCMRGMIIFGI